MKPDNLNPTRLYRRRRPSSVQWMACVALILSAAMIGDSGRAAAQTRSAPPSVPLVFDGFTEPAEDVLVSGVDLGRLTAIHVRMGDRVSKGDLLAQLDDQLQESALRISQAQADMTGEIRMAVAEQKLQQLKTESLRKLAADGMARPEELQRAEADLEAAKARVEIAQEQQRLRRLQVQRDQIELNRRKVLAPCDGRIARVMHAAGEYLTPADAVIFRLIATDTLDAVFNVPVEHIHHVQMGQTVSVFLRSQGKTVDGTVDRISPAIDGESGTVQVKVLLDNRDETFLAGDRCTLQLTPQRTARTTSGSRNSVTRVSRIHWQPVAPEAVAQ
ncbi:efflux RND transporter periplasmic adaptor subunit [Crateriforma spongiae]|uniref:efflux RND transporter periplasmic adaptor subunit n=1 Tax=Crateriforma spongiae TaxID=2724528 RepID=UPI0039B06F6D